jgi:hypothetical protein
VVVVVLGPGGAVEVGGLVGVWEGVGPDVLGVLDNSTGFEGIDGMEEGAGGEAFPADGDDGGTVGSEAIEAGESGVEAGGG